MAGEATLAVKGKITGLGKDIEFGTTATLTDPIEHGGSGKYIVHATAGTTAIQVSGLFPQIALTKMYCVYIESVAGTIYVKLNTAGTDTFDNTTADLVFNEGEGYPLPINPANNNGITIDAAAVTNAFIITALGSA